MEVVALQQRIVATFGHEDTVVQHQNAVDLTHHGEAVSGHQNTAAVLSLLNGIAEPTKLTKVENNVK